MSEFPQCPNGAVFVFGSNTLGKHGKGAALDAVRKHGAVYGQGQGRQGQSYAIATKSTPYNTLPLHHIAPFVKIFIEYAKEHSGETFFVTRIGCGLAGYTDADIGPMFQGSPANVILPDGWG